LADDFFSFLFGSGGGGGGDTSTATNYDVTPGPTSTPDYGIGAGNVPMPTPRPAEIDQTPYSGPTSYATPASDLYDYNQAAQRMGYQPTSDGYKSITDTPAPSAPTQKTGVLQDLGKSLGINNVGDALKAALSIGGGLMAYQGSQKGAQQAQDVGQQISDAYKKQAEAYKTQAQPLVTQGNTQLAQALQGTFAPAQQRQFQAAEAQLAQSAERAGGSMGAVQSTEALSRVRQQLIEGQTQTALALLGAGDPIMTSAIQAELNATKEGLTTTLQYTTAANDASARLMMQLANMGAKNG